MPELPDLTVYVEAIQARTAGRRLEQVRLVSPFLLRTVDPPVARAAGRRVEGVRRLGKRIVFQLEGGMCLALHLMTAGRLHWRERGARPGERLGLAAFDFETGTLTLTEAGTNRSAALHVLDDEEALRALDAGGLEPLTASCNAFTAVLRRANCTLKRALTDPRLLAGIGNAYSDEILHRARLSPVALAAQLEPADERRLWRSTRETLEEWTLWLRHEAAARFPEKVSAFRDGMAVHGRFGKPCPDCQSPIQRITRAGSECNYCANCQTGGRLLRDESPETLERMEAMKSAATGAGAGRLGSRGARAPG